MDTNFSPFDLTLPIWRPRATGGRRNLQEARKTGFPDPDQLGHEKVIFRKLEQSWTRSNANLSVHSEH